MTKRSKAPKDSARRAKLQREALDLRIAGKTYRAIGASLGVHHSTAIDYIMAALSDLAEQTRDKAGELRQIEAERLDKAIQVCMALMKPDDEGEYGAQALAAIDRLVKVVDRKARLFGLDAPKRHHVTGGLLPEDALRGMSDEQLSRLAKGEPLDDGE